MRISFDTLRVMSETSSKAWEAYSEFNIMKMFDNNDMETHCYYNPRTDIFAVVHMWVCEKVRRYDTLTGIPAAKVA